LVYSFPEVTFQLVLFTGVKAVIDQLGNSIDFVMFEGIIIGTDVDGYYYVADSEAIIYVRHKLSADSLAVGNSVQIIGKAAVYTNTNKQYSRQISGNYKVVKLDELTHDCPMTAIDALISDFDFTITVDNYLTAVSAETFYGKLVKFDLYVTIQGTYNDVYLAESMETGAPKILIYYKSMDIDGLKALAGTKVKVTAVVYDYSISSGWRLGFLDREGDLEIPVVLSDAEKLAIAAAEIETIVKEGDEVSGNLGFITDTAMITIPGVKYTWTTDDLTAISATGVFTQPAADKTVAITVNCFLDGNIAGTPSATWTINVTAKGPKLSSVIISQVYGGGGNTGATFTNDFIVLHNTTDQAIDLTGWTLFYASATGTFKLDSELTGYVQSCALVGSIPANGFYLIQGGAGTTVTDIPLPITPDASSTFNLSGTKGKLALCNNGEKPVDPTSANVVDFVGYGPEATLFEGAAAAPAPSNSTAIIRSTLTDTDNNSVDFVTGTPTPSNTSSPAQ
ncbi:MAG: lamin tail domain-containing protein, partial [Caldisericia bacterium]|nr:lamin tail domain-containing protein [Caldisericia bacterium]